MLIHIFTPIIHESITYHTRPCNAAEVQILYDENSPQKMNLIINGHKSKTFNLGSGVAQGCPLSPLLFLCVAEALTRAIKADKSIKGITVRGVEIKINQFADDTGLFLQDLKRSWTNTKKLLKNTKKPQARRSTLLKQMEYCVDP